MNKYQERYNTITWKVLAIFLGIFGVQHFYVGDKKKGFLYLCTAGLLGIGWLKDIFIAFFTPPRLSKKNVPNKTQRQQILIDGVYEADVAATFRFQSNLDVCVGYLIEEDELWGGKTDQDIARLGNTKKYYEVPYMNWKQGHISFKPEPDNAHDQNAISVYLYGRQIGYINREDTIVLHQLIESQNCKVHWKVYGGNYKVLNLESGRVNVESREYRVRIRIEDTAYA